VAHDTDLSRSRDIIDDVIIRSAISHFLLVCNWYQASISNRFRDISIQIGPITRSRLHLSWSNDVIGHVTIRYRACHFLDVPGSNQVSTSSRFLK